jgi:hypothetical protein
MKTVIIGSVVIKAIVAICITYAAVHFDRAAILWWYLLLPWLGWSYEGQKNKEASNAQNTNQT